MTDDDLLAASVVELAQLAAPMEVVLRPASVLALVGLIQLALRHPSLAEESHSHTVALRFVAGARAYFAACPMVLEIIRRGEDPTFDQ